LNFFDTCFFPSPCQNYVFFIVAAVYLFVLAVVLIVLQILACASVHGSHTSHPIIYIKAEKTTTLHAGLSSASSAS
jgi:hypothetical protein